MSVRAEAGLEIASVLPVRGDRICECRRTALGARIKMKKIRRTLPADRQNQRQRQELLPKKSRCLQLYLTFHGGAPHWKTPPRHPGKMDRRTL